MKQVRPPRPAAIGSVAAAAGCGVEFRPGGDGGGIVRSLRVAFRLTMLGCQQCGENQTDND
jgi:hypothetical protein